MAKRPVGLDTSELKSRIFKPSAESKVFGALHSTHSRSVAKRQTATVMGVIDAAMASTPRGSPGFFRKARPLVEPNELKAGLESLKKSKQLSDRDVASIERALKRDLND